MDSAYIIYHPQLVQGHGRGLAFRPAPGSGAKTAD